MIDAELQSAADAAVALSKSHAKVPAVDVLEIVFLGKQGLKIPAPVDVNHPVMGPRSGLGQLVAAAFDGGMLPQDWLALTSSTADPRVVEALFAIWRAEVLPRFAARFGLQIS